jgi:flagellar biosynthesis protein FlhG
LVQRVTARDPEAGARLAEKIAFFRPQIVVNQARTRSDIDLGYSIKSVCCKYFGVDAVYLGHIDHDNAVWQSLRKKRPIIIEHPYSSIVGQLMAITKNLLNPQSVRAVV